MQRRTFIKNTLGACFGPFLCLNSFAISYESTQRDIKSPKNNRNSAICAVGVGDYGKWALNKLLISSLKMASFEYNGTIDRKMAEAINGSYFTFILANPSDVSEVMSIMGLLNYTKSCASFTFIVIPPSDLTKGIALNSSLFDTFVTPSIKNDQNRPLIDPLFGFAGFVFPLCGENELPCFDHIEATHIAGGKSGTFHYGYSENNLSDALEEAIRTSKGHFKSEIKSIFISVLSTSRVDLRGLGDFVESYCLQFSQNVDVLWSWTETTLLDHKFAVIAYLFYDLKNPHLL